MKRKNLISLSLACIFTVLGSSGLLLYLKQKSHPIEIAHTIFGLLMVGFAIFHILNNWGSLKSYARERNSGGWKKELAFAGIGAAVILGLALTEVLEPVAEFGRIFAPKREAGQQNLTFAQQKTLENGTGRDATLILQRKSSGMFSALKVELADSTGRIISTLYEDRKPTEEDIEEKRILPNAIVQTKIGTVSPFRIIVTYEKGKQESMVSSSEAGIYRLTQSADSPLERGLIELN